MQSKETNSGNQSPEQHFQDADSTPGAQPTQREQEGDDLGPQSLRKKGMDSVQQMRCLRSCKILVITGERRVLFFPIKEKKDVQELHTHTHKNKN